MLEKSIDTHKDCYDFYDLCRIMDILRGENGCPWDMEQTHKSIRENFIEEVYEAVEAIDTEDSELLQEELGDVLLQVVFHAKISEQSGGFAIDKVTDGVCRKLIVRHPHIFGDVKADTAEQVLQNWAEIKSQTKGQTTKTERLRSVSKSLPALMRAEKVQGRAEKAGDSVMTKEQAIEALEKSVAALKAQGDEKLCGQVLFNAVKAVRLCGTLPETSLTVACDNFIDEFEKRELQGKNS
ncbi:MAG: MazG family protein [Ruminococcaceae bacterium]|nr:MazG family protein [Oscillospiraceae bacterium]